MKLEVKRDELTGEELISLESINLMLMDMAKKAVSDSIGPYLAKAHDARDSVNELLTGFGEELNTLKDVKKELIDTLRDARFTSNREINQIKAGVADMMSLVASEESKEKMILLRELVEISERLKSLKDECFFDGILKVLIGE